MREAHVLIQFDLTKLDRQKRDKLFQVETLLREIGLSFDTGSDLSGRDWEWDWSLKGPVKVYHKEFKDEYEAKQWRKKRKLGEQNEPQSNHKRVPVVQEVGC